MINLAIVGATGAVGTVLTELVESRQLPIANLYLLASARSAGLTVNFAGREITVGDLAEFDFSRADIALFSAGGSVSAEYVPKATAAGCVVVDNTSEFRYREDVPLVVAEVNPEQIEKHRATGIIANPNCSTMQMLVALKPIHDEVRIKHINVCTYQAVSGSGQSAINELTEQSKALLSGEQLKSQVYSQPIAFNVIPFIDTLQDNGYSREEMKLVWETRKILGEPELAVSPTAVRVPVFYGHSEAIHLTLEKSLAAPRAREILRGAPGIELLDDPQNQQFATPLQHAQGTDPVFVSRVRSDVGITNGLSLWVVSDNLRKGAALNSVQIAEILINKYL